MKFSAWIKIVAFVVVVCGVGVGLRVAGIDLSQINPDRVRAFVVGYGVWAPVIYLLAYGQPIIPLPASVMTVAGGAAFGPIWGTVAALCGSTIRACGQFAIARLLGRETAEKFLRGKISTLDQKIAQHGFKAVLLVRLIPNFPFDMQNYGLGFSQVGFVPYALGTFIGMIPGCFVFVYLGASLTDPQQLWKLAVAMLIIIAVMVAQNRWKSRHIPPADVA
jgi:uncharacterized membrane protein YdjX (TVP38/TMEM64 family)